jgi:hypothetical protein
VSEQQHSVQVVGYDNSKQAWLVKNSWGDGWANEGYGWVSFSAPGMCGPDYTWGFIFNPKQIPAASKPQLTVVPGRPGCYSYKAVPGDYPEALSTRFGLKLQQLLLDNLGVSRDPSRVPPGAVLVLCGVSPAALAAAVVTGGGGGRTAVLPGPVTKPKFNPPMVAVKPSPVPRVAPAVVMPRVGPTGDVSSSSPADEVAALLAIKRVLDPVTALGDWQPGSTTACGWAGVKCNPQKKVAEIQITASSGGGGRVELAGRLPSSAPLRRLPALKSLSIVNTLLQGTLPEDWSLLRQLEYIYLGGNALTGG